MHKSYFSRKNKKKILMDALLIFNLHLESFFTSMHIPNPSPTNMIWQKVIFK